MSVLVLLAGGSPATAEPADGVQAVRELAAAALARPAGEVLRSKANETCQPNLILCGQSVQSTLTTSDCSVSGGFADGWFFPNYSRQAVGVAMSTQDFDPLMGLFDPAGNILAAAEAPAGDVASMGAFLESSGNFEILVSAQDTSVAKTGSYLLTLECGADSFCTPDTATMCLQQRRFRVQVAWHNQFNNTYGFGRAIARTDSAGFFSFGDPNNIELLVKLLDFGNGTFKVFYGELTDLQFSVAISDMNDPLAFTKTYSNSPGDCGGIDQDFLQGEEANVASAEAGAKNACTPNENTICLLNRRFAMTMTWHNQFNNTSGAGGAVPVSDLTGAFFFTDKSDLELVAKVIDFGDRIAVFYGSLSNLEYDLTVTDTSTGVQKTYNNPPGQYCGGLDNTAFP
jgi:hypothetical protein